MSPSTEVFVTEARPPAEAAAKVARSPASGVSERSSRRGDTARSWPAFDKNPASVRRSLTAKGNPELATVVAMADALDAASKRHETTSADGRAASCRLTAAAAHRPQLLSHQTVNTTPGGEDVRGARAPRPCDLVSQRPSDVRRAEAD